MAFDVAALAADIESLAREADFDELENAVETFVDLLAEGRAVPSPGQSERILKALRGKRQFAALIKCARALGERGLADPTVRRYHAQALIDSIAPGDPAERYDEAVALLEGIVDATKPGEKENKEALGLIGRVWKQRYVDTAKRPPSEEDARVLQNAIGAYAEVVKLNDFVRDHWHFINFVALTARAERDGIDPNHRVPSRELAQVLLDALKAKGDEPKADMWTLASLGEAHIAIGDAEAAKAYYERYAKLADINAFELFSSARQLAEVWEVDTASSGIECADLLTRRVLEAIPDPSALKNVDDERKYQGTLSEGDAVRLLRLRQGLTRLAGGERLERLSEEGEVTESSPHLQPSWTFDILEDVYHSARSVCRIKDRYTRRHAGTGFLVWGEELHASLGNKPYLLTNNHVVSPNAGEGLKPSDAIIEFRVRRSEVVAVEIGDDAVEWQSPSTRLDATLIRIDELPYGIEPVSLCRPERFPDDIEMLSVDQRVLYFVGHAGDLQLTISPMPHAILDLGWRDASEQDHVFLHHAAPTRDGSSGSPLFARDWRVIALHRAGTVPGKRLKALGGRLGDREAKVGVSINAIRRAIARERAASAPVTEVLPYMQDEALLALLKDERVEEERLAQLVEWDADRSEPWSPVLKRRPSADGTVPQGPMSDAWWQAAATTASYGFRARRNFGFQRKVARLKGEGLTIVSDGDSWFQFPIPGTNDVIDHMRATHAVYCNAVAGSVLAAQAAQAHERILPAIKQHAPDAVLLSGGGNDVLGFGAIGLCVDNYREGATASDLLKKELEARLQVIVGDYATWIGKILDAANDVKIFCHGYDWALPDASGGRWLYRPLSEGRGIKDVALQRQIVAIIIDRFNESMQTLETRFPGRVFFVDCRSAVGRHRKSWFDELHPRSAGFGRVAARFNRRIMEAFQGDERVIGIA